MTPKLDLAARELEDFAAALKRADWDGVSAVSLDRAYRLGRDAKAQSWAMAEAGCDGWRETRIRIAKFGYSRLHARWLK